MIKPLIYLALFFLSLQLVNAQSIGVSPDILHFDGRERQLRIYNFNSHDVYFNISGSPLAYEYSSNRIPKNSYKDILIRAKEAKQANGTIIVNFFSGENLVTAAGVRYFIEGSTQTADKNRFKVSGFVIRGQEAPERLKRAVGIALMSAIVLCGLGVYFRLAKRRCWS